MKLELRTLNWLLWTIVFIVGAGIFIWMEWRGDSMGTMFWFIKTSIWSMFCAIGYSIFEWILHNSK